MTALVSMPVELIRPTALGVLGATMQQMVVFEQLKPRLPISEA
jgi:hypothetical protein